MKMPPQEFIALFTMLLFLIGLGGVLLRRNLLVVLMSIELMLNAVNLNMVFLSQSIQHVGGAMFVFFTITIGAAETAVGLAILTAMFRRGIAPDTKSLETLKG